MTRRLLSILAVLAVVTCVVIADACREAGGEGLGNVTLGAEARLGEGTVTSFARFNAKREPLAIGVVFSAGTLNNLPTARSDEHRCFDHNGDGVIQSDPECLPTHERVIPLPSEASRRSDIPFKWVLLNWNPTGHLPPHIYTLPHFDVHFFIEPIENIFALMPGPCGVEFLRCDQFERAVRPVPSNYLHSDFQNVDAAVPAMGNHLVDLTGPEFHGETFSRAWMFGSYDGRITFYEEMVTRDFLAGGPNVCFDIKSPPAVAVAGYYPTRSCFRFDAETNEHSVSMEGFVYREASAPSSTDS